MRRGTWAVVTAAGGLGAVLIALLVDAGALPPGWTVLAIGAVPLLALLCAFIGLMTSDAVIMAPVVAIVALVTPIIDMWGSSVQAGNFDDAQLVGLGTGVALAVVGVVAFIAELRKPARKAARPFPRVPRHVV